MEKSEDARDQKSKAVRKSELHRRLDYSRKDGFQKTRHTTCEQEVSLAVEFRSIVGRNRAGL